MKKKSISHVTLVRNGYQPTQSNLDRNNPPGNKSPAPSNANQNSDVSKSNQNPKK